MCSSLRYDIYHCTPWKIRLAGFKALGLHPRDHRFESYIFYILLFDVTVSITGFEPVRLGSNPRGASTRRVLKE